MGEIFNNLPNKTELERYIHMYAGMDNITSPDPASLEYLLRFWERNKKEYLFKLLGNQYIIEKNYYFKKNEFEIKDEIRQSCNTGKMREFYYNFDCFIQERYNKLLEEDNDSAWQEYRALGLLVGYNALAKSKVELWYKGPKSVKVVVNEDGDTITIQSGSKPIRLLAKFAQAWGIEGFEAFRLELSRILNDKSLKGTMCLSIHPLDYITMSDNPYDWESCMNWMNGGQYRMGTVEMMNSKYVVMAYIKGDKTLRFYNNYWNGKKWRNLFIVDKQFITAIKGYPYQSTDMDTFCLNWLRELAEKNLGWKYSNDIIEYSPDSNDEKIYLETDNCLYFTFETGVMYNDFGNNNTTHMILEEDFKGDSIYCYYSGETECMYCGSSLDNAQECNDDLEDSGCVICNNCLQTYHCDCCGDSFYDSSALTELDGEMMCETCYHDHAIEDINGVVHNRQNCYNIFLFNKHLEEEEAIDQDKASSVWVYSKRDINKYLKDPIIRHTYKNDMWWWSTSIDYITPDELNEKGKEFFETYFTFSDPDKCKYDTF